MSYTFHWEIIPPSLPLFAAALAMTFKVSIAAYILAIVVGLAAALLRMAKQPLISGISRIYVETLRAAPLLVIIIWMYYGISLLFGIRFTAFAAGVGAIGLHYGAFLSEIFRGGLQAVQKGQSEAALVLGLSRFQTMSKIILPQAMRIIIPPLGNSWVEILKSATLVSIIGLTELMRFGQTLVAATFRPFEIYTFVALVYVALTMVFSGILSHVERKIAIKQ